MNHKWSITVGIAFVLLMLVGSGCATSPTVTPCPTAEALSCPTPGAAQTVPDRSGFRSQAAGEANAIITFEAGDNCSMIVHNSISKNEGLMIEVVADDNAYKDYIVWIHYLDPGKTIEDLQKSTDPITPPDFLHIIGAVIGTPMSRTTYFSQIAIDVEQGPIYFTCQVYGPPRKMIGHLGPLELTE